MTSSQKPTQGQGGQQSPPDKQGPGLLGRYTSLPGTPAPTTPPPTANMQGNTATPAPVMQGAGKQGAGLLSGGMQQRSAASPITNPVNGPAQPQQPGSPKGPNTSGLHGAPPVPSPGGPSNNGPRGPQSGSPPAGGPPNNGPRGPQPGPPVGGPSNNGPRGPQSGPPNNGPRGPQSGSPPAGGPPNNGPRGPQPGSPNNRPGGNPAWGPQQGLVPGQPGAAIGIMAPQQPAKPGQQQQPLEIVDGNVVLYRAQHFYLTTAYRPGAHPGVRADPQHRPSGHTKMLPKVMPQQGARVASSETRMMPKIDLPQAEKKERHLQIPTWLEKFVIAVALLISLAAHAYNMFNFPRYELDEGTYMSSAWAIWNGMITPYAYGYGHPPLAWMQLAAGIPLVGGFFTFGNAINTGRVLMLFYAVGSSLLVYLIVRHLVNSRSAGLLALIAFSLSPLSINFQRQVFLDNIATFWLLLSLYLIVVSKSRLHFIVMGAFALGFAFLSKEVLALFVPGMVYAVWLHTTRFQRKFSLVAFTYAVAAVCFSYLLMAILKGELFPPGWLPGDNSPHLSFIGTYLTQATRGQTEGSFGQSWAAWSSGDILLMLCSIAAPVFNLFMGWWNRKLLLVALLAASFWLLLIRGGVVLSFYIIPLIPFAVINGAMAANTILKWFANLFHFDLMRVILIMFLTLLLIPYYVVQGSFNYTLHPTSIQTDSLQWIRQNVPHNSIVIVNSYLDLDLRLRGGEGVGNSAAFPNTLVYVNIDDDPQVYGGVLGNSWDNIDYFVADSEMLTYITGDPQGKPGLHDSQAQPAQVKYANGQDIGTKGKLLMQAFWHSQPIKTLTVQDHGQGFNITIFQVVHLVQPPQVRTGPPDGANAVAQSAVPIDNRTRAG